MSRAVRHLAGKGGGVSSTMSLRYVRLAAALMAPGLAGVLLLDGNASAQEFRGTILGRVTDTSGFAIPHVTVVVTNEDTNVASEALTQADGGYTVPFLNPGKYRVEASLTGFKKFVRSGVMVEVAQHVTVDAKFEIGDVSETVEVRAEASLLDRTSGGLGQTIDNTAVEAMPLNGRMIFMLNRLAGGVNWQVPTFGSSGTSGLRPFDNSGGSDWSMNGGRLKTNEFLLDGVANSTRGEYDFGPPVDAVAEFKIQTNTYDAQYGRTGGGVVNMTLKSGGNQLRGQAWNFLKNDALNANDTLNNSQGQPKPPYIANQYGMTVTGPIVRNRTFFMGTFEGLRERVPFPTTTSVPSLAERGGDFGQSYVDQKTPLVIYDPLTTTCDAQQRCTRLAFPNNNINQTYNPATGTWSPANRVNPVAQRILNLVFPAPTIANQRVNNYVSPINKGTYDYDSELVKIDHAFSDTSKVFVRLDHNHRDEFRSTNGLQGTFASQGQWPQTRINRGAATDWVTSIGTRGLLNVRGGFSWFTEDQRQLEVESFDRSLLGFQNLPGQYMPLISMEQFTNVGVGSNGRNASNRTASVQANYTWSLDRQTIRIGGEYRHIEALPATTGQANGQFAFTRAFTRRDPNNADTTSGDSVASFLLGYPATSNSSGGTTYNSEIGGGNQRNELWHYTALYVQDDFRVSPKLTVNLGLRWDYESGVIDANNQLVRGFAFDQTNPLASQIQNRPGINECPACANLEGGLLFAGVNGVPRELFNPQPYNFQPRAGFAYSLNDKTVVRGGYGLYYAYRGALGSQVPFFVTTPYIANDINGRVGIPELGVNTFSNPFPNGLIPAPGSSLGLLAQVGRGISFDNPDNRMPHIHEYNATLSREITRGLMVEVSYVGSQTRDLSVTNGKDINAISAADMAKGAAYLQAQVPNPFAGLLPGTTRNGTTIQRQELLRPYPEFGGITENSLAVGKGWYNSLQLIVRKRVSRGLSLISSYTFSKTMEQNEFLNPQDAQPVKEVTNYDRPHIWQFSGTYELPFGHGKTFARDINSALDQVIGGWQVNWNFNWQSGKPVDMPGALEAIPGTSAVLSNPTPDRWFNTCYLDTSGVPQHCLAGEAPVWQQRPPFTLRTTPHRFSDVRAPWRPTLDASAFKRFTLPGRFRFELRAEAFNLTNVAIFDVPNTTASSADFGTIPFPRKSIYFARNIQIGMKLFF
jgi:hypothetical protein